MNQFVSLIRKAAMSSKNMEFSQKYYYSTESYNYLVVFSRNLYTGYEPAIFARITKAFSSKNTAKIS